MIRRIILIEPCSKLNVKWLGKRYMAACTLAVVAATIPDDVEVIIIDEDVQRIPWELMGRHTLVGVTCITHTADRAYEIAKRAKEYGSQVILGGIHPTAMSEESLGHADAVVWGEVEGLWPEIIADATERKLKGVYKLDEPPDITNLPMPRWDLIDRSRYRRWSVTYTSRGCPHDCSFCSATAVFGKKVRFRSTEDVIRDVRWMKEHGADFIFFTDDNIAVNPRRLRELCQALVREKIRWGSQCHAAVTRDEETVRLMAESGCFYLLVGFESLSLDREVSKKMKGVDVREAIEAFHRHGILLIGCFICGLQGETDYWKLADLINECIDIPQLTVVTPMPGTRDYEEAAASGKLLGRPWHDFFAARVVSSLTGPADKLRVKYDWVAQRVYSYPQIMRRSGRNLLRFSLRHALATLIANLVYRQLVSFRDQPTRQAVDQASKHLRYAD